MNLISKDKTQLIALLQKTPMINVIDITEGKPASLAEKNQVIERPKCNGYYY